MKEKIKIICLIMITVAISFSAWVYIQKGIRYLNAYEDCMKARPVSWICISILNGGGQ